MIIGLPDIRRYDLTRLCRRYFVNGVISENVCGCNQETKRIETTVPVQPVIDAGVDATVMTSGHVTQQPTDYLSCFNTETRPLVNFFIEMSC